MELLICKNSNGVEIFNNGSMIMLLYSDRPELKDLKEDEIKDLFLSNLL